MKKIISVILMTLLFTSYNYAEFYPLIMYNLIVDRVDDADNGCFSEFLKSYVLGDDISAYNIFREHAGQFYQEDTRTRDYMSMLLGYSMDDEDLFYRGFNNLAANDSTDTYVRCMLPPVGAQFENRHSKLNPLTDFLEGLHSEWGKPGWSYLTDTINPEYIGPLLQKCRVFGKKESIRSVGLPESGMKLDMVIDSTSVRIQEEIDGKVYGSAVLFLTYFENRVSKSYCDSVGLSVDTYVSAKTGNRSDLSNITFLPLGEMRCWHMPVEIFPDSMFGVNSRDKVVLGSRILDDVRLTMDFDAGRVEINKHLPGVKMRDSLSNLMFSGADQLVVQTLCNGQKLQLLVRLSSEFGLLLFKDIPERIGIAEGNVRAKSETSIGGDMYEYRTLDQPVELIVDGTSVMADVSVLSDVESYRHGIKIDGILFLGALSKFGKVTFDLRRMRMITAPSHKVVSR